MRDAGGEMVGEVGADTRQIVSDRDADRLQMGSRSDARDLQQVRRVDSAARHHTPAPHYDLACDQHPTGLPVLPEGDPEATAALHYEPCRDRLGYDPQIWPPPCLGQEGACRRPAKSTVAGHLRIADPFLHRAVVVAGQREARLLCGFDKAMGQRQDGSIILDQQWAILAAVLRVARRVTLGFLEM